MPPSYIIILKSIHFQLGYAYEFRSEAEKAGLNYRQCFAAVGRMTSVVGRAIAAAAKARTKVSAHFIQGYRYTHFMRILLTI